MRSGSLMRWLGVLALAGLVVVVVPAFASAGWTDFEEKITVEGHVPIALDGVRFLVAQAHLAEGRYRTFPEPLRVSQRNRADRGGLPPPARAAAAVRRRHHTGHGAEEHLRGEEGEQRRPRGRSRHRLHRSGPWLPDPAQLPRHVPHVLPGVVHAWDHRANEH